MRSDYKDDKDLAGYLESAKTSLKAHYIANYRDIANTTNLPTSSQPVAHGANQAADPPGSPEKFTFTSRYSRRERVDVDELVEYFKLVPEDWEKCDPIEWWYTRRTLFPTLHRFALDMLSIPGESSNISFGGSLNAFFAGSAVAVERIFSGGRDTISLRRSSLQPDTIRALMLLKNRLRMARRDITLRLGD